MASKGGVVVVVAGKDDSGELFHAIDNHLAELRNKAKETSTSLGSIGPSLLKGLQFAGITIGIREVAIQLKDVVGRAVDFGEAIEKAQIRTGMSAGTLSVLHYAADVTNTDYEKLVKSTAKMGKTMADAAEGDKKLQQSFRDIGVDAKQLVGRGDGIEIAFKALGQTLLRTESPARRNQLLINLLQKAGIEAGPTIMHLAENFSEYEAKARSAGMYMDQMSAQQLKELNEKMRDLKERVLGASISFTEGIQPALEGIVSAFAETTNGTNIWNTAGKQAGLTAIEVAGAFNFFGQNIRQMVDEIRGLYAALDYVTNRIDSATSVGAEARARASARRDAAKHELDDAIADHKLSEAEEQRFHDALLKLKHDLENPSHNTPQTPAPKTGEDGGSKSDPPKAVPGLLEARERAAKAIRELAAEGAKTEAEKAKAHAETLLAILESQHKLGLISESAYLAQKQAIQEQGFKSEQTALEAEKTALSAQMRQLSGEKPKTEKDRLDHAAKLNDLQKQMIELDGKLVELGEQRKQKEVEIAEARTEAYRKQRAQIQEMEADLEQRTGGGSVKSIVAQRQKSAEERQNLVNGGATRQQLAEFDALEKLEEEKIKIAALDRDGERIRREAALAEAKVEQQALGHAISNREADQQLASIRADEIAQLQQLSAAYAQYGEAGRDAEARVQSEIAQTMQAMAKEADTRLKEIGEGYAHALFDPLFDMSEAWNKKGKSIADGLMRMTSQIAEKQFMGFLFGDDAAGGNGSSGRNGLRGTNGLVGEGLASLDGLFHKKSSPVSNGTGVSGPGSILSSAASAMQVGKSVSGNGSGVQVILNNNGSPMQVESTQQSGGGDGGESQVIQIVLKQLDTNGPVAQRLASMFT
jgi:hypothetical protein